MHAHTHIIHVTFSFLSINSTDQENPPPDAYGVGERQAGAQNRGTKTTAVQSNMRGASHGRGRSRIACTRLAGDDTVSASDDSGKSAYIHAHAYTHTHTHTHTYTYTYMFLLILVY